LQGIFDDAHENEFDRKKALRLYSDGATDSEIALELGVNVTAVASWRKECGWPEKTNKLPDKWERARVLYAQGWSDGKIGKEIGVSGVSVLNWRRKNDLPANTKGGNTMFKKGKKEPEINKAEEVEEAAAEECKNEPDYQEDLKNESRLKRAAYESMKDREKFATRMYEIGRLLCEAKPEDGMYWELAKATLEILRMVWECFPVRVEIKLEKQGEEK